jgi:hypothetical protein
MVSVYQISRHFKNDFVCKWMYEMNKPHVLWIWPYVHGSVQISSFGQCILKVKERDEWVVVPDRAIGPGTIKQTLARTTQAYLGPPRETKYSQMLLTHDFEPRFQVQILQHFINPTTTEHEQHKTNNRLGNKNRLYFLLYSNRYKMPLSTQELSWNS